MLRNAIFEATVAAKLRALNSRAYGGWAAVELDQKIVIGPRRRGQFAWLNSSHGDKVPLMSRVWTGGLSGGHQRIVHGTPYITPAGLAHLEEGSQSLHPLLSWRVPREGCMATEEAFCDINLPSMDDDDWATLPSPEDQGNPRAAMNSKELTDDLLKGVRQARLATGTALGQARLARLRQVIARHRREETEYREAIDGGKLTARAWQEAKSLNVCLYGIGGHMGGPLEASCIIRLVFASYREADRLPETDGSMGLPLRPGAVWSIQHLCDPQQGDSFLWGGCGTAPEVISMALLYPAVRFVAIDVNATAIDVAVRKVQELRQTNLFGSQALQNLTLRVGDLTCEPRGDYTHIYSTAIAGHNLYVKLRRLGAGRRLIMLREMWENDQSNDFDVATVYLCVSGGEKPPLSPLSFLSSLLPPLSPPHPFTTPATPSPFPQPSHPLALALSLSLPRWPENPEG